MPDPTVLAACKFAKSTLPFTSLAVLAFSGLLFFAGVALTVAGFFLKIPRVPLLGIGIPAANSIFWWGIKSLVAGLVVFLLGLVLLLTGMFASPIAGMLSPGTAC